MAVGVAAVQLLHPDQKPVGYTSTVNGRRKRIYDKPATPWQRLQASGVLDAQQLSTVAARIEGFNPAAVGDAPSPCAPH